MRRIRFRQSTRDSFSGEFLYQQVVPQGHFLLRLREVVPWGRFTKKLWRFSKGGAEYGPPPDEPVRLFKMLVLSDLYNSSERRGEEYVNDSLSARAFLGLGADERAPDHASLTVFKNRLLERAGAQPYQGLLGEIVRVAQEQGVRLGHIQVVDAVHTVADVNVEKDEHRKKGGKGSRDPDARWGVKGTKPVRDEAGEKKRQQEYFFGYKAHVSLSAQAALITSLTVTPGAAYDGHQLPALVEADLALGLPVRVYTGDRGYDDGENHLYLWSKGLKSALRLNTYRTQKKDPNKGPWLRLVADPDYQAGLRERYQVARTFGEAKLLHGLRRCRSVGLLRYAVQAFLTAMVLNLKRLVKLVRGATLGSQSPAVVSAA